MALKVGELFATINLDDKGFNKGLKAAHTALNGLKTALKGVTWATGIMGAAWSAVGATSIKYNANIEQLQTSFEVMTGSAEKGAEVLQRIRKLGAETPFETEGLAETVQLLMNYNLTADKAIDVMKMLGDVAQGDQEKLFRIATAYGQMSSAGKVMLEDIRQMIEAGFNPLAEISQTTGESMASLYERISKGKVTVDEITASMERSTSAGGKYFQSMKKQSQTVNGLLSTLKDNAQSLAGDIMAPISEQLRTQLLPDAIGTIEELNQAFEQDGFDGLVNAAQKQLPKAGKLLQKGLKGITTQAKKWLPGMAKELAGAIPDILEGAFDIGDDLVDTLFDVAASAVEGLVGRLPELVPALGKGIWDLGESLLKGGYKVMEGLGKGLLDAAIVSTDEAWEGLMERMVDQEASANIAAQINATVDSSGAESAIQTAYDNIYQVLTDGAPDTKEAMNALKTDIGSTVNELMEAINEWEQEEIAKLDVNSADYEEQVRSIQTTAEGYRDAVKSVESETVTFINNMAGKSAATVEKEKGRLDEIMQKLQKVAEAIDFADSETARIAKGTYDLVTAGATTDVGTITQGLQYVYQNYKLKAQEIEQDLETTKKELANSFSLGDITSEEYSTQEKAAIQQSETQMENLKQEYIGQINAFTDGLRDAFRNTDPTVGLIEQMAHYQDVLNQLSQIPANPDATQRAEIAKQMEGWWAEVLGEPVTVPTDQLSIEMNMAGLYAAFDRALAGASESFTPSEDSPFLTILNGIFSSDALAGFEIDTSTAEGAIKAAMGDLVQSVTTSTSEGGSEAFYSAGSSGGSSYATGVSDAIGDGQDNVQTAAHGLADSAQSGAASMKNSGVSVGRNFAQSLARGITAGTPAIQNAARAAALAAKRAAESALQIHSPSKVSLKIGGYFSEGMADGILKNMRMVSGAATQLAGMAAAGLKYTPARRPGSTFAGAQSAQTIDYDRLAQAMAEHQTVLVSNGKVLARSTAADNSQALGAYKLRVAKGYGG